MDTGYEGQRVESGGLNNMGPVGFYIWVCGPQLAGLFGKD